MVAHPLEHVRGAAHAVLATERRRALDHRLDEREAIVIDALGNHVGHVLDVEGRRARDVRRTGCLCELAGVKGAVDGAVRCRRRLGADWRRRRSLAARHAVDVVVEHDDREVHIAAAAVDEVIAADGRAVAIARDDDDVEVRVGELDARRERNGAAVRRVQGIKVHVARGARRAANARDDDRVVLREALLLDRLDDGLHRDAVAAARAPEMRQMILAEILFKAPFHHALPPAIIFSMAEVMSSGSNDFISYLPQSETLQPLCAARRTSLTICP